jgi:hypothetical protein
MARDRQPAQKAGKDKEDAGDLSYLALREVRAPGGALGAG